MKHSIAFVQLYSSNVHALNEALRSLKTSPELFEHGEIYNEKSGSTTIWGGQLHRDDAKDYLYGAIAVSPNRHNPGVLAPGASETKPLELNGKLATTAVFLLDLKTNVLVLETFDDASPSKIIALMKRNMNYRDAIRIQFIVDVQAVDKVLSSRNVSKFTFKVARLSSNRMLESHPDSIDGAMRIARLTRAGEMELTLKLDTAEKQGGFSMDFGVIREWISYLGLYGKADVPKMKIEILDDSTGEERWDLIDLISERLQEEIEFSLPENITLHEEAAVNIRLREIRGVWESMMVNMRVLCKLPEAP
jgi:hypothetical protein